MCFSEFQSGRLHLLRHQNSKTSCLQDMEQTPMRDSIRQLQTALPSSSEGANASGLRKNGGEAPSGRGRHRGSLTSGWEREAHCHTPKPSPCSSPHTARTSPHRAALGKAESRPGLCLPSGPASQPSQHLFPIFLPSSQRSWCFLSSNHALVALLSSNEHYYMSPQWCCEVGPGEHPRFTSEEAEAQGG